MTQAPSPVSSRRHAIGRDDIMPMDEYGRIRAERRRALVAVKRDRRLAVGPYATFHFESYETMWSQVHEMLFIERGGEAQVEDELRAYNPLIPKGRELVATVMFEIDDPLRRKALLGQLGGVENTLWLEFAGEKVRGLPEADLDRTSAAGKASSVQFVHFPFADAQVALFRQPNTRVVVGVDHDQYPHMTVMPEAVRAALAGDFD
ncbi:DUF3501 family protein [Nitrospirillum viridazoti]|uniref:DUF3501 domain-containing protein n=1 Tax=Nitrospirillum viridazoti CBAmc TaxID=1441467 RepID=A0A248JT56_9PROT|nr:DUF3501 family protein [Nitrospirillum amazonense]ASG21696.1 hypothetical protein Y958_13460 [Nitrospirillum amazonense CBAmc]TWB42140.1 uncharacterized protein DUF3501 [Nitrospirillum amazonense]